jgi:2-(1,2-epoxy-1,2-dihydrophenyl)acetyl-CoA isomerase
MADMPEVEGLAYSREGAVATVRWNRPEHLNAITFNMLEGVTDFVEAQGKDPEVRAIVITGTGRAFSSGDDIVGGMGERSDRYTPPDQVSADLGPHHRLVKTIMSAPKPVIAALNGLCHGAGWVTALACDFRVAHEDVVIGDIRAQKSIFAGQSVPLVLPRLIGQSRAMDLLMTGRVITAAEAERFGIIQRLWPVASWEQDLEAFIQELASGPTQNYAAWKLAVNWSILGELDHYTAYERPLAQLARTTEDSAEGVKAFREKRPPVFTGR